MTLPNDYSAPVGVNTTIMPMSCEDIGDGALQLYDLLVELIKHHPRIKAITYGTWRVITTSIVDPVFINIFNAFGWKGWSAKIIGGILGLWAVVAGVIIMSLDIDSDGRINHYTNPHIKKIILGCLITAQIILKMGGVLEVIKAEKAEAARQQRDNERQQRDNERQQRDNERQRQHEEEAAKAEQRYQKLLKEIRDLKAVSGDSHAVDQLYDQIKSTIAAEFKSTVINAIDANFDSNISKYDVSLHFDPKALDEQLDHDQIPE
jgi:uncharacterized FlaG/YvyC family protein